MLKRLRIFWSGIGLATKQFLYLSLVTLTLFLILAATNQNEAESMIKEQVARDAELMVARTNQFIDTNLAHIENILLLLSDRTDLLLDGNEAAAVYTLKKYVDYNRSIARTIYLMRADGKVNSSSQLLYDIIGNPHLEELYRLGTNLNAAIKVSEPYYSPVSGQTVAYVMPIVEEAEKKGVIIIEINLDQLSTMIAPLIYQTYTVVTEAGNVVNRLEPGEQLLPVIPLSYPPKLSPSYIQELMEMKRGVNAAEGPQGPLMVVKSDKNRLGWSLIAFIEEEYYYKDLQALRTNYQTATILWIIILLVSAFCLSRYFTRPIRKLVHRMNRVHDVQIVPRLVESRKDEIGRLVQSYNAMLERIQNLLQKTKAAEELKKEYELKMLRSQISPHFLYNTLACISTLAKRGNISEVQETIRSLVQLFAFSFDKHSEFVSIEEELEGLKMYMYIQQVRYGKQHEYSIDTDTSVLQYRILKLTLQPLVENALFHGIVPKGGGHICIRIRMEKSIMRIYIRDNGVGMSFEQRRNWKIQSEGHFRYRFTGIGIKNVDERIHIHHGSAYGIKLGSLPEKGTIIRLDLPLLPPSPNS